MNEILTKSLWMCIRTKDLKHTNEYWRLYYYIHAHNFLLATPTILFKTRPHFPYAYILLLATPIYLYQPQ